MTTLTLGRFIGGQGVWQPRSPWHPLLAVLATIVVIVLGQLAPIVAISLLSGEAAVPAASPAEDALHQLMDASGSGILLLGQATLALLTLGAASLYRRRFSEVLSLVPADGGGRAYLYALVVMVPLVIIFNVFAYWLSPSGFASDLRQFVEIARMPDPLPAFLAISVGAPLWEEMLFRGFLIAPLAAALGFWRAAVLVSGAWTMLHFSYSIAGLAEVFLIGLYFSWLLWRTGSLWVPIASHAAYNACLFIALRHLSI